MPPATTGPGPLSEPPSPLTPSTVWNSRFVLYSQSTDPSLVDDACTVPSFVPESTTPGNTVIAASCATPHPGPWQLLLAGGATHTGAPVSMRTAWSPPGFGLSESDSGK